MTSPILARADALMHRRRPGSHEADDIPVLTDAVAAGDDIRTLLAEETAQDPVAVSNEPVPEDFGANSVKPDATLYDELADELIKRVHARLAAELPAIVDHSLRELLADPAIVARLRSRD